MTNYIGWTPPPGVGVVAPPVHPQTVVDVIYSDGGSAVDCGTLAGDLNWSAVGDGPAIVAYAIVEEYKPAPETSQEERNKIALGALISWIAQSAVGVLSHSEARQLLEILEGIKEPEDIGLGHKRKQP